MYFIIAAKHLFGMTASALFNEVGIAGHSLFALADVLNAMRKHFIDENSGCEPVFIIHLDEFQSVGGFIDGEHNSWKKLLDAVLYMVLSHMYNREAKSPLVCHCHTYSSLTCRPHKFMPVISGTAHFMSAEYLNISTYNKVVVRLAGVDGIINSFEQLLEVCVFSQASVHSYLQHK